MATSSPCPCGRGPALPGHFECASCANRRAPAAPRPPAKVLPGRFVPAPKVEPSRPRKPAPLPPLPAEPARRIDVPCSNGCGGIAHVRKVGLRAPGAEYLCDPCLLRARRERAKELLALRGGRPRAARPAPVPEGMRRCAKCGALREKTKRKCPPCDSARVTASVKEARAIVRDLGGPEAAREAVEKLRGVA